MEAHGISRGFSVSNRSIMDFTKLHERIPLVKGGKEKILSMSPYKNIELKMPGRHAADTTPVGGDFVVCVTDENLGWNNHQFTHTDIFVDVELKTETDSAGAIALLESYARVVQGADPEKEKIPSHNMGGMDTKTFLRAVQCLAVAEHRRYAKYEDRFGGRYLPLRFAAGIVEGHWSASDAIEKQRRGRPGVEWLERDNGKPQTTKTLMS